MDDFLSQGHVGHRRGQDGNTVGIEGILGLLLYDGHVALDRVLGVAQVEASPLLARGPALDISCLRREQETKAGGQQDEDDDQAWSEEHLFLIGQVGQG